jgi:hypothetical protein
MHHLKCLKSTALALDGHMRQYQVVYYVAGPPSAPLLELSPLVLLSFLVSSRHTRRPALPPGHRGGAGSWLWVVGYRMFVK